MANITEDKLNEAIEYVEEVSDKDYENLLDEFIHEQEAINGFLDEQLEDLGSEDESNDIITTIIIIYKALRDEFGNVPSVNPITLEKCKKEHNSLMDEIQEISRTS